MIKVITFAVPQDTPIELPKETIGNVVSTVTADNMKSTEERNDIATCVWDSLNHVLREDLQ